MNTPNPWENFKQVNLVYRQIIALDDIYGALKNALLSIVECRDAAEAQQIAQNALQEIQPIELKLRYAE
jgi:hypothetical protein